SCRGRWCGRQLDGRQALKLLSYDARKKTGTRSCLSPTVCSWQRCWSTTAARTAGVGNRADNNADRRCVFSSTRADLWPGPAQCYVGTREQRDRNASAGDAEPGASYDSNLELHFIACGRARCGWNGVGSTATFQANAPEYVRGSARANVHESAARRNG